MGYIFKNGQSFLLDVTLASYHVSENHTKIFRQG
ncbi:hypothetical protein ND931_11335 [Vibrio diabolicus]|nr:hypothetical protein [Vibrio diabolicus]